MKTNKQTTVAVCTFSVKKFILSLCFFSFTFFGFAQQYSYYLVQKNGHSLAPTSKTTNPNGTISLTFSNSTLNTFFQGKTIYTYEKAFPQGVSAYLDRVYKFVTNNPNLLSNLNLLNDIEHSELDDEGVTMLEPNDPYYVAGDIGKNIPYTN